MRGRSRSGISALSECSMKLGRGSGRRRAHIVTEYSPDLSGPCYAGKRNAAYRSHFGGDANIIACAVLRRFDAAGRSCEDRRR